VFYSGDYAWNRDEEMAGGVVWTSKVEEHVAALVTKVGTDWDIAAKTLKRIVIDEYKKKFYRRKASSHRSNSNVCHG
jgi:hypothetical protein